MLAKEHTLHFIITYESTQTMESNKYFPTKMSHYFLYYGSLLKEARSLKKLVCKGGLQLLPLTSLAIVKDGHFVRRQEF